MDKKKIKEQLEEERDVLIEQLKDMGKMNPETGDWEPTPEDLGYTESDQNDMADRFEEFESRSSMMEVLEPRLKNVLIALKKLNNESFGLCKVCKNPIEAARMEANPAAKTCKEHLED